VPRALFAGACRSGLGPIVRIGSRRAGAVDGGAALGVGGEFASRMHSALNVRCLYNHRAGKIEIRRHRVLAEQNKPRSNLDGLRWEFGCWLLV
jgi:hypothetical protein